jgi:hypothetical protein
MFAVMQMFCSREDARFFWKESYDLCRNKLMEAEDTQCKLRNHVRKLKKKSHGALGALQT